MSIRSVPSPVSVTVLPWLHHAHCSFLGDIIIWLGYEILDAVPVQSNKEINLGVKYLTSSNANSATFALEGHSIVHHVFLTNSSKNSQILLSWISHSSHLCAFVGREQLVQAQKLMDDITDLTRMNINTRT